MVRAVVKSNDQQIIFPLQVGQSVAKWWIVLQLLERNCNKTKSYPVQMDNIFLQSKANLHDHNLDKVRISLEFQRRRQ